MSAKTDTVVPQQDNSPELACLSKEFSQGNKNKNRSFCGDLAVDGKWYTQHSPCIEVSHEEESGTHTVFTKQLLHEKLNPNVENVVYVADQVLDINDSSRFNHDSFGFNPLGTLKLYTGDPVYYETIPDIIKTHIMVQNSGCLNVLKCLVSVDSNLNIENWKFHLVKYWDQQIVDLLQNGFPLDFNRDCQLIPK